MSDLVKDTKQKVSEMVNDAQGAAESAIHEAESMTHGAEGAGHAAAHEVDKHPVKDKNHHPAHKK